MQKLIFHFNNIKYGFILYLWNRDTFVTKFSCAQGNFLIFMMIKMPIPTFLGIDKEDWLCVYYFQIWGVFFSFLGCRSVVKNSVNLDHFGIRLNMLMSSAYIFRHQPLEFIGKVLVQLQEVRTSKCGWFCMHVREM